MRRKTPRRTPVVGERVELARYTVRDGTRIVYGQVIGRVVRVTDCPAFGRGRAFLVERGLERDGYSAIQALVEDYTRQAGRLNAIPMAASLPEDIEQVELGRYAFTGGERILYGQRVNDVVRVTDRPARGDDRSYLVERGLDGDGYSALETLVADYTREAVRLDAIPMTVRPHRHADEEVDEEDQEEDEDDAA
jgi:hypothetical protein